MSQEQPSTDEERVSHVAMVWPLLGLFFLMPPIITLFARGVGVAGVPLIVVYVFGVWCALIVGAFWLARRLPSQRQEAPSPPEPAESL